MHLDHVAVRAMERGVHVEDGLDVIVVGGERGDAGQRVTDRSIVNHRGLLGLEPVDIHSEQRRRIGEKHIHLESRLGTPMG
jgi:hypothetical protein